MTETVVSAGEDTLRPCLQALDAILHSQILRLRARYQLSLDEFRGLYISNEQVEALARQLCGEPIDVDLDGPTLRARTLEAALRHERLVGLAVRLELSATEMLILLMAVAPALEPKYETLYAYLNNDVTRKGLTVDLALRLAACDPEQALVVRAALAPGAPLLASGLLHLPAMRESGAGSTQHGLVSAHPGLANFLLGLPFRDPWIVDFVSTRTPAAVDALVADSVEVATLAAKVARAFEGPVTRLVWIEQGAYFSAYACALAFSSLWDRELTIIDLRRMPREATHEGIKRAALLAQIHDAVLLVDGLETLCTQGSWTAEACSLRALLRVRHTPVLLAAPRNCPVGFLFDPAECLPISVQPLSMQTRKSLWDTALRLRRIEAASTQIEEVARRFRLGPELIDAAALRLSDEAHLAGRTLLDRDELFAAARAQADTGLDKVAHRVLQRFTWDDLVLPPVTRERVRSLIDALRSRERVLEEWGMGRALGTVGLRALFAGPSGTGKTMTAAVIARELGVDVYRIDLSQTVSKYIGETEKNLERIFQAAERAHAILFFDEADALLGKRAEVKDAHDRYANIEVAYLLQRLEEFDGIVIVATNISRNIDAAFSRRMQFVIEFPLPGSAEREKLWRAMFPASAPLAADVDFEFLGRRFELVGGDIRNVVLDAAFLAARGGESPIGMRHIAQALARELLKQGRSASVTDFRQHYALLESADGAG